MPAEAERGVDHHRAGFGQRRGQQVEAALEHDRDMAWLHRHRPFPASPRRGRGGVQGVPPMPLGHGGAWQVVLIWALLSDCALGNALDVPPGPRPLGRGRGRLVPGK
ncbi:hypothetical protein GCM10009753_12610 [Streptantibioticus ferralitis]